MKVSYTVNILEKNISLNGYRRIFVNIVLIMYTIIMELQRK